MDHTSSGQGFRDEVSAFVDADVRPTAREADETATFPESVWDGFAERELTGMTVPAEYGGVNVDSRTASVIYEELGRGSLAVATALSVHCLATACIASFGSKELCERWLPPMAEGRPVGAFALSEPHAGSNPAAMQTEARPVDASGERVDLTWDGRGDDAVDAYVVDGQKQWITNGQRAGVIVLFARTDRDDPDSITQFLVPADAEGLTVGEPEDKLGLRASDTTALTFDDVEIPAEHRLTPVGDGLSAAYDALVDGRISIASQAVGVARCALERAIEYSQEREQFGEPIADSQSIRHKLARMATRTQAARLLARDAARKRDAGDPDAPVAASMAKYAASEAATFVTNEAVQIHGGHGYVTETEVERLYRDAKVTEIYEGTTQIQQSIVARHLLE